jgi:hypothetical protein
MLTEVGTPGALAGDDLGSAASTGGFVDVPDFAVFLLWAQAVKRQPNTSRTAKKFLHIKRYFEESRPEDKPGFGVCKYAPDS